MSAMHAHHHVPSREELFAGTSRPLPRRVKMICLAALGIGAAGFVIGLFLAPSRVWQALHVNWLYLSTISSAGVTFVAVQRITTARWSRPVIRFLEGYVAFLPAAFVLLLLLIAIGKIHNIPKDRYRDVPALPLHSPPAGWHW
jgi:hypothetical protein